MFEDWNSVYILDYECSDEETFPQASPEIFL